MRCVDVSFRATFVTMNLVRALAALSFVLLTTNIARADAARDNIVLADLGLHVIGVGYQRTVGPRIALQADLESYTPWTQNIDFFGLSGSYRGDVSGVCIRARAFFYLNDEAPTGWWISPFAQAGLGWGTRDGAKETGPIWAVGASAGYAFLIVERVHIAIGLGAQFHAAHIAGGSTPPSFARFYPTLDASLGYAF